MINIIQGEKQPYTINIQRIVNDVRQPFDLTGFTEIKVCFKDPSTLIEKLESAAEVAVIGDPILGQIGGDLLIADTDSMTPTEQGSIEIQVTFAPGDVRKAQIINAYSVTEKLC